jgi:hypothetical protein
MTQTPSGPQVAFLSQSVGRLQTAPISQLGQVGPPQSRSDSSPLITLSVQLAAAHAPSAPQTWLTQSSLARQGAPTVQGLQLPPQSTLVSSPSIRPLLQPVS